MQLPGVVVNTFVLSVLLLSNSGNGASININPLVPSNTHRPTGAVIIPEAGTGFRLIYSYQIEPRVGEPELGPYIGHCELVFDPEIETAAGDYFNSGGRTTFGQMEIREKVHG